MYWIWGLFVPPQIPYRKPSTKTHLRHPHPPGELTEFNPMAAFRAVQGPSTKGAAPDRPHHQL